MKLKIGLEIHLRLNTAQKLFSDAKNDSLGDPNTRVAMFDLAIPGVMPRVNLDCVVPAIMMAMKLNCSISPKLMFDRKHYVYRDLPLGFQITQVRRPIGLDGYMLINGKRIGIQQVHMECDAAKTDSQMIDYNRCGVPLVEIVTRPNISTLEELSSTLKYVRTLAVCYGVSIAEMSRGDMRCDVNVSWDGVERQEIKNLNSMRFAVEAVKEMIKMPVKMLQSRSTWGYMQGVGLQLQRSKESAFDYMYLPEVDVRVRELPDVFMKEVKEFLDQRSSVVRQVEADVDGNETLLLRAMRARMVDGLTYVRSSTSRTNLARAMAISSPKELNGDVWRTISRWGEVIQVNKIKLFLERGVNPIRSYLSWGWGEIRRYLEDNFREELMRYEETRDTNVMNFLIGRLAKRGVNPKIAGALIREMS